MKKTLNYNPCSIIRSLLNLTTTVKSAHTVKRDIDFSSDIAKKKLVADLIQTSALKCSSLFTLLSSELFSLSC